MNPLSGSFEYAIGSCVSKSKKYKKGEQWKSLPTAVL